MNEYLLHCLTRATSNLHVVVPLMCPGHTPDEELEAEAGVEESVAERDDKLLDERLRECSASMLCSKDSIWSRIFCSRLHTSWCSDDPRIASSRNGLSLGGDTMKRSRTVTVRMCPVGGIRAHIAKGCTHEANFRKMSGRSNSSAAHAQEERDVGKKHSFSIHSPKPTQTVP